MISLICGLISFACFMGIIGAFASAIRTGDITGAVSTSFVFVGLFWVSVLLGLGTGIAGLAKVRAPKALAIIGVIINGLWLLLMLVNMVAGK